MSDSVLTGIEVDSTGSQALDVLQELISLGPMPAAGSVQSQQAAEAIGRHLVWLVLAAAQANQNGQHSATLALLRSMEDALDCFAAVSLVPGAAERWSENKLKASEAARLWEPKRVRLPTGKLVTDYRKGLRSFFNEFAHCSPALVAWNLYGVVDPPDVERLCCEEDEIESVAVRFVVNHEGRLLSRNAIRLGAFLSAHVIEFAGVAAEAYELFLRHQAGLRRRLERAVAKVEHLLKTRFGAAYLENTPPEIQFVEVTDPNDPDRVMTLHAPHQANHEPFNGT